MLKNIITNSIRCSKEMFTKEYWWVFASWFAIGFCIPSIFTDNYWINLLFGASTYPIAILTVFGELEVKENKKKMHEIIKDFVASQHSR